MKTWTNYFRSAMGVCLLGTACGTCLSHADPQVKPSKQALSVRSTEEITHISSLIKALQSYAAIYDGNFPATINGLVEKNIISRDELKKLTMSPLATGQESGADGYLYFFAGKRIDTPGDRPLIVGKFSLSTSDFRRAVGLQDGSVTWWKKPQVETFLMHPGK